MKKIALMILLLVLTTGLVGCPPGGIMAVAMVAAITGGEDEAVIIKS